VLGYRGMKEFGSDSTVFVPANALLGNDEVRVSSS
jgi:hypothetical protein